MVRLNATKNVAVPSKRKSPIKKKYKGAKGYLFRELVEIIDRVGGVNLKTLDNYELAMIRNEQLFPFLKKELIVLKDSHEPALALENLNPFLILLSRVVP